MVRILIKQLEPVKRATKRECPRKLNTTKYVKTKEEKIKKEKGTLTRESPIKQISINSRPVIYIRAPVCGQRV